jgi:hypothetical protein
MFGSKKEPKQDLRQGMWESGPRTGADFGEDRPRVERGARIVSPDFAPQAEGQTTHE